MTATPRQPVPRSDLTIKGTTNDAAQLRARIDELENQLETEIAQRTTTELIRQIAIERADIARADGKAQSLATLVSLIGAAILAVATTTGALKRLSVATTIVGGTAVLTVLVVLGLSAAVLWPAQRLANHVFPDPTTVASLHTGLTTERDRVTDLTARKFRLLRAAMIALAFAVVVVLATVATAV